MWIGEIWELLRLQWMIPMLEQTGKLTRKGNRWKEKREQRRRSICHTDRRNYRNTTFLAITQEMNGYPTSRSVCPFLWLFLQAASWPRHRRKYLCGKWDTRLFPVSATLQCTPYGRCVCTGAFQSDLLCLGCPDRWCTPRGSLRRLRDDCLRMHPCSYSSP